MPAFICLLEYGGGTYVSRIKAVDAVAAVMKWLKLKTLVKYLGKPVVIRIREHILRDRDDSNGFPTKLRGIPEVAFIHLGGRNHMHVIKC
jgi:hypothetical protein